MAKKYSDISLSGKNLSDIDSVMASIDNILKTRIGERPFNRDFGSRLEDYLFEPYTFSVSRLILSEIISSINKWEKRAEITAGTNVTMNPNSRIYEVVLNVKIKGFEGVIQINRTLEPK